MAYSVCLKFEYFAKDYLGDFGLTMVIAFKVRGLILFNNFAYLSM